MWWVSMGHGGSNNKRLDQNTDVFECLLDDASSCLLGVRWCSSTVSTYLCGVCSCLILGRTPCIIAFVCEDGGGVGTA